MMIADSRIRPLSRLVSLPLTLLLPGLLLILSACNPEPASDRIPLFEVKKGPLVVEVVESGTIQAADQIVLKNELEGRTTLLYLIEEGTRVEEGTLLVELDDSRLRDERLDQQIRVENIEAEFIVAREDLEVVRSRTRSELEEAQLKLRFAREDLVKYEKGEFPQALKEAEAKILIAEEELRQAQSHLKWSEVLAAEEYIAQSELQADQLAQKKATLDLELAQTARDLLLRYDHERRLAELRSGLSQAELELERTRRKGAADLVQAEARLRARESELAREKQKLLKVEQQIERARIFAPEDGLVVYATTGRANWRGNQEPLAEGKEVREREELILLPASDAFVAEIKIHESMLVRVSVGQKVRVSVDALPGLEFEGVVANVSPLPDAASVWFNPDLKVYNTQIRILGDVRGLRTGMSCTASIRIDRIAETLYVPVQSVVRGASGPLVYLRQGGETQARAVQTGLDNGRMVQILEGLEAGQEVLLAPPLDRLESRREPPRLPPEGEAAGAGEAR